jgi:single-stranded-DNA-specific exonuclease
MIRHTTLRLNILYNLRIRVSLVQGGLVLRLISKTWHLQPHDPAAIEGLARALGISPIVAQLLLNRDQREPEAAGRFLQAPLSGLYEPERLPGVVAAVERIHVAIQQKKRLCVYGDYDVDGVSGTAILLTALRHLGADVDFHVPHRLEDGYGLSNEALAKIAAAGTSLVVTVDCGIASIAEADEAKRLNLELIVTDHHEPKDRLPDAAVLVHPRLAGDYPWGYLSGAGVAFKLAWALCKKSCGGDKVTPKLREFLLDAVAFAALGTVADVVPLCEENRIFVRHGLARLKQNPPIGLKALLESANLANKAVLTATDIGYSLGPRLNAAGRLGSARLAVELLTTPSPQRAADLARWLEEQNGKRQMVERRIYSEAREMAEGREYASASALVLASASWHAGLIGIVAGRLMEAFGRPVVMIALQENGAPASGSGRSIAGFRLHEALQACSDQLLSHGGHATAAGFKIIPDAVSRFREQFCQVATQHFGAAAPAPRLVIDAEVPLSALTAKVVDALAQLEPYGAGNAQPVFLAGDLQIAGEPARVGGGERHLSFRVRQGQTDMRVIAFGMADRTEELMAEGGKCSLAFTPKINEWQGRRRVELEARDFQSGPRARLG